MSSQTVIESLHEQASCSDVPLAPTGLNLLDPELAHLAGRLVVDDSAVRTFMAGNGVDPEYLRRPLLRIVPITSGCLGFVSESLVVYEEQAYYPYIQLGVRQNKPNIRRLNRTLRHELGHLSDPAAHYPLYGRPLAPSIARLVGMGLLGNTLPLETHVNFATCLAGAIGVVAANEESTLDGQPLRMAGKLLRMAKPKLSTYFATLAVAWNLRF